MPGLRRTLSLLLLALASPVSAETFCVTSSATLQQALDTAAGNGQDDLIKVAAGYYPAPAGGFLYNATLPSSDGGDLALQGGYTEFFGNACGALLVEDPNATVLAGASDRPVMSVWPKNGGSGDVTVRLLSFVGGHDEVSGGGLSIGGSGFTLGGAVTIERNVFVGNEATYDGGLGVYYTVSGNGRFVLAGNLIVANHGGAATISVASGAGAQPGAGIYVFNNTIVDNDDHGLIVKGAPPTQLVANNIFWGNGDYDLYLFSGGVSLLHNDIGQRIGSAPTTQQGNISVQPQYEPGCLLCVSRVPRLDSPLVDAGLQPRGGAGWQLTSVDAAGRPRLDPVGKRVDIGAYESQARLFSSGFEPH